MDEKTEEFKNNQKLLKDELRKYKNKESSYSSFMQSMEDISTWLKERGR